VRNKGLVPEKLEEKGPEKYIEQEDDCVIKALTGVPGMNNSQHFIIFGDNNGGGGQRLHEFPGPAQVWVGARVHL
jgi:hypothetical protein